MPNCFYFNFFRIFICIKTLNCNKSFEKILSQIVKTKNNFCSRSCAARYNNSHRTLYNRKYKLKRERIIRLCFVCNNSLKRHQKICCSDDCFQFYRNEKIKQKIEQFGGFEKEDRKAARKYLIEKYGHICSICNITEWANQPVPLVCDHIDGNSENNLLSNLRMVCQNCNALLPTFGIKNKGNGRRAKREQYQKDKVLGLV